MSSHIHTSPWAPVKLPECSVYDLLWSNPNGLPDTATAVIDGPSGRIYTRGDMKRDSQSLAYGLRNTVKLQPESVVCIFSPNTFYYHMLVSSLQCAGLVVSGANAAYTQTELLHQLTDSSASFVIVHPAILNVALQATTAMGWNKKQQREKIILAVVRAEAGPAIDGFKCFDDFMGYQLLTPHPIKDPKNTVAYLGYSSGTSGAAKGVRTSHYNMTSVLSILGPFNVTQHDVQIAVLPLNHIYGLSKLLHWPIITGTAVVISPPFKIAEFCAQVERHKVSVALLVPPIILALARDPVVDDYDLTSLRLICSGAAPMGSELEEELAKRLPKSSFGQAFGMTESSPTTNWCPIEKPKPGSIGPLLPMLRSRIVDPETGKDVTPGKEGEYWIQGPTIMLGYLNRPEANAETLFTDADGTWLRTGDIGFVDHDGYHYITDRLKELIKVKGFQVAPSSLEALLLTCPLVKDVGVIGIYDPDRASEFPRAYIVPTDAARNDPQLQAKVADFVKERVAAYKQLKAGVVVVEAIPKSPSGKILRRELRVLAAAETARAKL